MSIPRITEILENEIVGFNSVKLENESDKTDVFPVVATGGKVVWIIVEDGTATLLDGEAEAWPDITDELDLRRTPLLLGTAINVKLTKNSTAWVMYRAG